MKTAMLFLVAVVFHTDLFAQADTIRYKTVPADARFAAGKWKSFWWGKHWREEWLQPLLFPVFNWDTVAGGVTPIKKGGGHETKSLRVMGKDGKEYVLRTLYKSLDVLIPQEFKGSFIQDIINDQISTAHPYGSLVAAHLSGDIGILHTNPVIYFVPDHPVLGGFANDFANQLCLFEERPSGEGWTGTPLIGYRENIVNSEKLFLKLKEDHDRSVDQEEYLKVRLFDMLINDWDRHEDQWVWAAQKKNGRTIYRVFARDRDQSFSKNDGINLWLLSRPWALRNLQNMDATLKDVIGTNFSARFLDKQFTNALSEPQWRKIIHSLQTLLPDSVLLSALHHLPPEIYRLSADYLYNRLRARRDNMLNYGMKYYKVINREVTIMGSDQKELFNINRISASETEITVISLDKKNIEKDTIYHRIFHAAETNEITLYGLDGNDRFVYYGLSGNRITTRALGGEGDDQYTNLTKEYPFSKRSLVYDNPSINGKSTKAYHYLPTNDTTFTNYHRMSFGYDYYVPLVWFGSNIDDGLITGASFTYRKKQWGKSPYRWQQTIGGTFAAATGSFSILYNAIFKQVLGNWDFVLESGYKAPTYVVNFYGYGNETERLVDDKRYYRARAKSITVNPSLQRTFKRATIRAGLLFSSVKVEKDLDRFITNPAANTDATVFYTQNFGGAGISYDFNTTGYKNFPKNGIHLHTGITFQNNLSYSQKSYLSFKSSLSFYFSPLSFLTVAHRSGFAANKGDYEFYQANSLGGTDNLRGYRRSRFTGQTAFYQNTDLRISLGKLNGYVLRGAIGIYGFFDDGRVWTDKENSRLFHTGYGGGVFLIPYNSLALNFSYGCSQESNLFHFHTGFLF